MADYPDYRRRIIPTCVGSTNCPNPSKDRTRDHPHLRGEHGGSGRLCRAGGGSSPPAWGAPRRRDDGRRSPGIIPTCVGSTLVGGYDSDGLWDHPHLRGEHY